MLRGTDAVRVRLIHRLHAGTRIGIQKPTCSVFGDFGSVVGFTELQYVNCNASKQQFNSSLVKKSTRM
jgi:hypothetical protein